MLAYCDFIADRIRKGLINSMGDSLEPVMIDEVGKVQWDLGPAGEFRSTKKTVKVVIGGKDYQVTVEEV
jgi:hypothetical protein